LEKGQKNKKKVVKLRGDTKGSLEKVNGPERAEKGETQGGRGPEGSYRPTEGWSYPSQTCEDSGEFYCKHARGKGKNKT